MSGSASEKIVIDGEIFVDQARVLSDQSEKLASTVAPARAQLSGTSFGALNTFLAGAMNSFASRTAEVAGEAAEMANRMASGVSGAHDAFAGVEEAAADTFNKLEGES